MGYRVQSGDTLWAIAQRFDTSVEALQQVNPQLENPDLIYAGQELSIPGQRDEFTGTAAVPSEELEQGAEGEAVRQLQSALVQLGYMTEEQVATGPGTFGPRTAAALRSFQADHGVSSTGYYGPQTRQALASALGADAPSAPEPAPKPALHDGVPAVDLKKGDEGPAVEILQRSLVQLGYMTDDQVNTSPGTFGPRTEAALSAFQRAYGVSDDGIYGDETRAALANALDGAAPTNTTNTVSNGGGDGDFRSRVLDAAQGQVDNWNMYRYLNGDGPEAWCNDFVSWCYQQAGKDIGPRGWYRYVPYMQHDLKASSEWLGPWEDPSPGDIVCFDWDHDGVPDHTGIVESVNDDGTISTIEGNVNGSNDWNGELSRVVRNRSVITGFGHLS